MIKYDFHMHSTNSLDGRQTVEEACLSAIEKGLCGIAITDHADINFFEKDKTIYRFINLISDIGKAKEKFGDKLEIFTGIEVAEYLTNPEGAEKALALTEYDVVLGSVHTVLTEGILDSYSSVDFSVMPMEKIISFVDVYFDAIIEMINNTDFDILTHLTCPLRYINGKYGRGLDIWVFEDKIKTILSKVIDKGITLEINTSGYAEESKYFMPERDIVALYYEMGGRRVSIGADAHVSRNLSVGFEAAEKMLVELGFEGHYIFRKREPIFISFGN